MRPRITGTLRVGRVARLRPGVWVPAGAALTYRWFADGSPIPRATHRRLPLVDAHVGKRLKVRVRARAVGYSPSTAWTTSTVRVRR